MQLGAQDSPEHNCRHSEAPQYRASARAISEDDLERVSGSALGIDCGCRFFTVEVWTTRGLKRFIVLFLIDLSTRKIEIAGIASSANGLWMSQIGRRVTDVMDGILNGRRYLIHDRDPLFTLDFRTMLASVGVQSVKLPPQSPNLNAHAERFVRSIKESCLNRIIFFGETSLRRAVHQFVAHYHHERNH
jgi:putative transposase